MSSRFRKYVRLSRDKFFILKASLVMLGVSFMVCGVIWATKTATDAVSGEETNEFADLMGTDIKPDLTAEELAALIRNRAMFSKQFFPTDYDAVQFHDGAETSPYYQMISNRLKGSNSINEGERERLSLLLDALHQPTEVRMQAIEKLKSIDADKRYRNEFLGDAYLAVGEPELGIDSYILEGENFPSIAQYSLRSAMLAVLERREKDRIKTLLAKPGFKKSLDVSERLQVSELVEDYKGLFFDTLLVAKRRITSNGFWICLLGAVIWYFVFIAFGSFNKKAILFSLLAVLMGMCSDVLTLYLWAIQEGIMNFTFDPNGTLLDQLIHGVLGVCLREEVCKLVCFVPVLILVIRYREPILVLVTAGMTGLGFAFLENVGYIFRVGENSAVHRLLSANALHMALTGIVGFALYQLIVNRGRRWENFLMDFLFVVAAHGLYNSFGKIVMLQEYSIVSLVLLALIVYRYLDLIRENIDYSGIYNRISPLGILVLGTVFFACVMMFINTWNVGINFAIIQLLSLVVSSLVLAFVFVNRFRDL